MVLSSIGSERKAAKEDEGLVQWSGKLPVGLAEFLTRQEEWDLRSVQGAVTKYSPVRQLMNMARLLHMILKYAPKQAAEGRRSFAEVTEDRRGFEDSIRALNRQVNQAAVKYRLQAPRGEGKGNPRAAGRRFRHAQ